MIWKIAPTLETLQERNHHTMGSHLGIEFTEIGDNFLKAKMPVDQRTKQPFGIMHGGASCVLAETLGSVAASFCIDLNTSRCVGVEINTSHIRAVSEGWVTGTAIPLHIGRTTQVWEIRIEDSRGKLVSMNRLRLAVIPVNAVL